VAVLAGPTAGIWRTDDGLVDEISSGVPCVHVPDPSPWLLVARLRRRIPSGGVWRILDRFLHVIMIGLDALSLPDPQAGWFPFAAFAGLRLARRFRPDVILVSGPPWSPMLVAKFLSRRLGIPLVLDYRDPWTHRLYPDFPPDTVPAALGLSGIRRRIASRLERGVLSHAAAIVTAHRAAMRGRDRFWVPNGYDPDDIPPPAEPEAEPATDRFTLTYAGGLFAWRDPRALFRAIDGLLEAGTIDGDRFRVRFFGSVAGVRSVIAPGSRLSRVVELHGYAPHAEVLRHLRDAGANLVLEGDLGGPNRHTPGKFYEVLAVGRPVLLLCPDGTTTRLARRVGCCWIAHPNDEEEIARQLELLYEAWNRGDELPGPPRDRLAFYDRTHQADRLSRFLERICLQRP